MPLYCCVHDSTQRELLENASQSEAGFATLSDKSLQAILIFQERRIVYVNPASVTLYGYTEAEMLALSSEKLLALVHPLDRSISDERARKRRDGEAVSPVVELRIVRKNGSVRWIQSFNNPIEFRGRPAILSTSIDITERKEAEEAQRAAERRLQYVVASSPAVLFTLQIKDGAVRGISWMSDNVEAMLGYPVSDTLGGDWWTSNVHPDDRDEVAKRFRSEIFTHGYCADEYRFRHRDRTFRWIEAKPA